MKRECPRCGTLTEFSDDYIKRRGYMCNPCKSRATIESAKKHKERKYSHTREYQKTHKFDRSEYSKRYRNNNPEKKKAHSLVQTAIRNGSIIKQQCLVCGDSNSHAHHDDYTKPLEIKWLCHIHHMELHSMLKAREGKE
jgi:ribosomal protein S27AE/uncharacterized protein YlaI